MQNQRCKNENATPRDRISNRMFREIYGNEKPGYAMRVSENEEINNSENSDNSENTEMKSESVFEKNVPLAMAYVPSMGFSDFYSAEEGFTHGTIFRLLDFPFYGDRKGGTFR